MRNGKGEKGRSDGQEYVLMRHQESELYKTEYQARNGGGVIICQRVWCQPYVFLTGYETGLVGFDQSYSAPVCFTW